MAPRYNREALLRYSNESRSLRFINYVTASGPEQSEGASVAVRRLLRSLRFLAMTSVCCYRKPQKFTKILQFIYTIVILLW